MSYHELLSERMQETLKAAGYISPTPIQEQSLPLLMEGKDLVGLAQTGTGKTAAFAVPIIEKAETPDGRIQALVLCPTRELALQTTGVFKMLSAKNSLHTVCVYGGQAVKVQLNALKKGADIVVGTPGRVRDLIGRGALKLGFVRFLVLDEADEMLDYGFLPDIKRILACVTGRHQTMLFSATMSPDIDRIAKRFLHEPEHIEAGERNEPTDAVRQMYIKAEDYVKLPAVNLMIKEADPRLTLIFCNTKIRAQQAAKGLKQIGVKAEALHGDLTQKERDAVMGAFRSGETRVLVATDVAARGIDVDDIDLVINFDVPEKPEYYVHRIGRTGRAGRTGLACTLVSEKDRAALGEIRRLYHVLLN